MSETPRCDAFGDEPYKGDNARLVLLWIRFAESLERDLTQAKAELAAVTAERDALREELNAVLSDWNDVVRASGSKTNGGLVGHVISLKADAERWRTFESMLKADLVNAQATVWNSGGSRRRFRAAIDSAREQQPAWR